MSLNVWKDVSPESIQEQVSISLLITHLISGCSIWDFLVFLPRDWEIFKHRTCCRWGMLALYAGCRYLGFVAMAATLVFVDMFPTNFNRNLGTAFQMLSLVSLGTAFTVLSLRIALALSQAVMWAVAFASFPRIPTVWQDKSDHIMVSTVLIILSTELLLLGVIGPSTRRFRADHHLTSQGHTKSRRVAAYPQLLYQQGIHYFAIVWAAYLPAVVFDCMAIDLTGLLRFTIQYVAFCTTVVCACKAFRDMMISGACPTHEFLALHR
ncbi:unnamed protein product [Somion occarium]|uniref:Uncharacterized protein n=1 Tax=Somion occarium TaxID=3059160 RepID=A0ABP1DXA8_9APHY